MTILKRITAIQSMASINIILLVEKIENKIISDDIVENVSKLHNDINKVIKKYEDVSHSKIIMASIIFYLIGMFMGHLLF